MLPTRLPVRERGVHSATPLMAGVMLLIGLANIRWAEQLTVNGGFGWDGLRYGAWARDFYAQIVGAGVPDYYVGRLLPSAIVHYGLRALGVTLSDGHIILAFQLYNLSCLLVAVWAWGRIARVLDLTTPGAWLGFCFLFLNFAILKNNFYHAVLTDTTAFTLGILTFYCYLIDSRIGLLAVMVAGGFTWSTVTKMAALLFVFPRAAAAVPAESAESGPVRRERIFALAVALVAVAGISAVSIRQMHFHPENHQADLLAWWPFSVALVFFYLWFALKTAAAGGRLFDLRALLGALRWRRAMVAGVVLAALETTYRILGNGQVVAAWFGLPTFLSAVTEPALFLVAHVVYYGPAIILIALLWRPCCARAREFGLGLEAFVVLNVIASVNSQSRFLINAVSTFVILMVITLDRRGVTPRAVAVWAVVCVICSKVWYTFNTAPQIWDGRPESLAAFPLQHYFMNAGPWMSHQMYVIQGAIVVALAVAIAAIGGVRPEKVDAK